jgi:UPF0716 protein FxsA
VRRLAIIVALLVIVPIIEIAVLIAVGQVIGLGWTLLLMLATSVLGGWLLRREGARAWRVFQADVVEGRPPGPAATNGVLVLAGGVFMLVPGFVSDVIGLLCIAPPTRAVARGFVMRGFASRMSPAAANSVFGPRRVRARTGEHQTWDRGAAAGERGAAPGEHSAGDRGAAIEGEIIDP